MKLYVKQDDQAMRIEAPSESIDFEGYDMHGEKFRLSDYRGKAIILSFFRNTSCPFCLKRVFKLATYQKRWRKNGIEVITVFSSRGEDMTGFQRNKFERFRVIPDPELEIYNKYGIEESFPGFIKGLLFKMPTIIDGFSKGGKVEKNPHGKLMPADFLIDPSGTIVESWYGSNAADNIPMEKIDDFVSRMAIEVRIYNARK